VCPAFDTPELPSPANPFVYLRSAPIGMDWTKIFRSDGGSMQSDGDVGTQSQSAALHDLESPKANNSQSIIEVAHGLDHTAQGPKYKRGRGRSFFSEAPKKVWHRRQPAALLVSLLLICRTMSNYRPCPRSLQGAVCQVPQCDRPLHKLKDYYKVCTACLMPL
jgi:hypothetical protein